jgi:hypothetical protein
MKYKISVQDCYGQYHVTESENGYQNEARKLINQIHAKDDSTSAYRVVVIDDKGNRTDFMVFKF